MLKPSDQEELWQTMRQLTDILGDNVMLLVEKGLPPECAVDMVMREWATMLSMSAGQKTAQTDLVKGQTEVANG